MDYSSIITKINEGSWEKARQELDRIEDACRSDADFYVLLFRVMQNLNYDTRELTGCLSKGMSADPCHAELFICLAESLFEKNPNQARLCLEQAELYCREAEDLEVIRRLKSNLEDYAQTDVRPLSVVIVSYDCKDMLEQCIDSIRSSTQPSSCEIVVVDNASTDGAAEWLKSQKDIKLILNRENTGFGHASNQGVKIADPDADILFLNNDTYVPKNAIFWLRMGLYESEKAGAAGSVSNNAANNQTVPEEYNELNEWLGFARSNNVPMQYPYEKKIWLSGFALLVKRKVLDKVGLFDEIFGTGFFEDNDLGVRILREGYELLLCRNSFIFHYGSQSFNKDQKASSDLLVENSKVFRRKWGFDINYYTYAREEIIDLIDAPKDSPIRILDVGCGMGGSLLRIQYLYPNAELHGIEIVNEIAKLGAKYHNIIQGDIETMDVPYDFCSFDYIICADVIEHLRDPRAVLRKLRNYLKPNGCLISSIPNVMHASVLLPLLRGSFEYEDAGILDRTHLRFFTLKSIITMMAETGYQLEPMKMAIIEDDIFSKEKELIAGLVNLLGDDFGMDLKAYQYVFKARK